MRRLVLITKGQADVLSKQFNVVVDPGAKVVDTLKQITEATAGLDIGQRAAKFRDAFELLGITSATGLSASDEQIRGFITSFENASGALDRQLGIITGGAEGAIDKLKAAFNDLKVSIGTAFLDVLTTFAKDIKNVLLGLSEFIQKNQDLAIAAAVVVTGISAMGAGLIAVGVAAASTNAVLGLYLNIAGRLQKLLKVNEPDKVATQAEKNAAAITLERNAVASLTVAVKAATTTKAKYAVTLGAVDAQTAGVVATTTALTERLITHFNTSFNLLGFI